MSITIADMPLTLLELARLPINRMLLSAAVQSGGVLKGVGGLGGKLAAARQIQGETNTLLAVGLSDGDAPDETFVGDTACPILRADTLQNLARELANQTLPRLYGRALEGQPTQPRRHLQSRPWIYQLIARHIDESRKAGVGSCTLLTAGPKWGKTCFSESWTHDSHGLQIGPQQLPWLAGWVFARRDIVPVNVDVSVLLGLEQSARMRLDLPYRECKRNGRLDFSSDEQGVAFANHMREFLQECGGWSEQHAKQPVILLIDAVDEVWGSRGMPSSTSLPSFLTSDLPAGVHIVLTSRSGRHLNWRTGTPHNLLRLNMFKEYANDRQADAHVFIQARAFDLKLAGDMNASLKLTEIAQTLVNHSKAMLFHLETWLQEQATLPTRLKLWESDHRALPAAELNAEDARWEANETVEISVCGVPDNWEENACLHFGWVDQQDQRSVALEAGRYTLLRWDEAWKTDSHKLIAAVTAPPADRPCVIFGWPGRHQDSALEKLLSELPNVVRHSILVVFTLPLVTAPPRVLAHVMQAGQAVQPVDLSILPGLNRGAYVTLIESSCADTIFESLRQAELYVPEGQARRWWLDLGTLDDTDSEPSHSAVAGADLEWVRRFNIVSPLGLFIRHASVAANELAKFINNQTNQAVVIVSAAPAWLDTVASALSAARKPYLRIQVGCDVSRYVTEAPGGWDDPLLIVDDLLNFALRNSAPFKKGALACNHLCSWASARIAKSPVSDIGYKWDFAEGRVPDLATAIIVMHSNAPAAAAELVETLCVHMPALGPLLVDACAQIEPLRGKLPKLIAELSDAFGDAAAFHAIARLGDAEIKALFSASVLEELRGDGPKLAQRLALATVRQDMLHTPTRDELVAAFGPSMSHEDEAALQGILNPNLAHSVRAVYCAARAGARGSAAISRLIAQWQQRASGAEGRAIEPCAQDDVLWAAAWSGPPGNDQLTMLLSHQVLLPAFGMLTKGACMSVEDIDSARLGIAPG